MSASRLRVLIFIVAFNAERTIRDVLERIPATLRDRYDFEVLVIDDASADRTFERGDAARRDGTFPYPLQILFNPENQGYGGNQKVGFHYAMERGFDVVALVHGDGQYAPESLPDLLEPIAAGEADAVFGSRMMTSAGARRGGMPLYKFVGNRVLSTVQNRLLRERLSEFHSGYRVYSVRALELIPFDLNTNDFHFDTEIIIQLLRAQMRITEVPIPTYYGDEICHVNGMRYAKDVVLATTKARVQDMDLIYDAKFDCQPDPGANQRYRTKLGYSSTHAFALDTVEAGSRVLDIGCGDGRLAQELRRRGCRVSGIDAWPLPADVELDEFYRHDVESLPLPVRLGDFDYVLLLDVIEHLRNPEAFVSELRKATAESPHVTFVISTGNIAFMLTRLLLLAGQFNYGKRGILDMTHTRLYTFRALRRLLESGGFKVLEKRGVPAPFPEAVGEGRLGRLLLSLNEALIRLRPPAFAYQMFFVVKPRASLPFLLKRAEAASAERSKVRTLAWAQHGEMQRRQDTWPAAANSARTLTDRFEELHRLVAAPTLDLPLENWRELYDQTLEFQPDLVLELGRGYGNSTSVFTEAAQSIQCRIVSVGFDSEHAWETLTAPQLARVVDADWFAPLTVIQDDITTFDFRPLLEGSTRTLVYWDAHGADVAEAIFERLIPALPQENAIVVDDVWQVPEQYGQRAEYRAGPLWSLFDEIVVLWDYLSERDIEFVSGSRSITFTAPIR